MPFDHLPHNLEDRHDTAYRDGRHAYLFTAVDIDDNPYDSVDAPDMRRGWTDAKDEANGR